MSDVLSNAHSQLLPQLFLSSTRTITSATDTNLDVGSVEKQVSENDSTPGQGAVNVPISLDQVRHRISTAISRHRTSGTTVQLVAVSKTKPIPLIMSAYNAGHRHFGENYVQELKQKATEMPDDIKWHFIGALQSKKAKMLASIPNLYIVESVDKEKTAVALDKAVASAGIVSQLKVLVQVNTSGEDSKSGCEVGESADLVKIIQTCKYLQFSGLMTIGAPDDSEEPAAFRILREERDRVADVIGVKSQSLILSMGMSDDFETAIEMGSDSVRVGSTIFGARIYENK